MLHLLTFISRTGVHAAPSVNAALTGESSPPSENRFKTLQIENVQPFKPI